MLSQEKTQADALNTTRRLCGCPSPGMRRKMQLRGTALLMRLAKCGRLDGCLHAEAIDYDPGNE